MINKTRKRFQSHLLLVASLLVCLIAISGIPAWASSTTQVIEVEVIREKALQYLTRQLTWPRDRMQVDIIYKGGDVNLPEGMVDFEFRFPGHKNRLGTIPFNLTFRVDNVIRHRATILANVEVRFDVVQATTTMQRGHVISEEDVKLVEIASTNPLMNNIMTNTTDVIGQEVVSNLRSGDMISNYMIKRVHVVKRGDRILLVAEKGPLRITAPGLVQENGFQDAMVRVQNLQTQKTVYGTVMDSKTVKVEF
ncbi:flagellar basal body P-ring formation chaperone FlgA [Nitrospina watsonii]|uniref:Flagella basal body P-ring formation protein FlgA n=1 Tax=Nitrospina watsonii TaxID=1323948 RepID=A0ABM9HI00_9BACT|nr:flagellar basal body P-ring formation chaperone FlgA [Nitrospina watsonii]CAI2719690.1 Flagellar basal-body P-ring formation protein flgA [Nitrospina watsonii]